MSDRDETLRLLRAHLEAAAVLAESLLPAEPAAEAEVDEPGLKCPHCGEGSDEKLEDTSTDQRRVTCLSCDRSFSPAMEVQRG